MDDDARPNQRPNDRPKRDRTIQNANLLRGISPDSETRARQIAALKPGMRVTHGARGGAQLGRARERHEAELARDYPALDRRRRAMLADLLGRVELASAWVEHNGLGPGTKERRGEVWAIVDRLQTWSNQAGVLLREAEAQRRGTGAHVENIDQYVQREYGT